MSLKIVIYNGSPRGLHSNTKKVIDNILKKISYRSNLEISYIDSLNYKFAPCSGCAECFSTGKCPLEKKDDMRILKRSILEADLVVLGTPIFAGNVSSHFKNVIDRLAYWLHLMCLCGKPVINITTSSGNGVYFTDIYLKSIVKFLGGIQIASGNYTIFDKGSIYSKDVDDLSSNIAKRITEWLNFRTLEDNTIIKDLDKIFHSMKRNIKLYEENPNFEYYYWKDNGLFNFDTYEEVIRRHKSITEYLIGGI